MPLSKQYTNVCSCSKPSFISLFENRNENQIGPVSLFVFIYVHNKNGSSHGPVAYKESRKAEANHVVAKQAVHETNQNCKQKGAMAKCPPPKKKIIIINRPLSWF